MGIPGQLQPAETSHNIPEMVTKLCEFFGVPESKRDTLLQRVDLVQDYLIQRGGLTHNGTRAVIRARKEKDPHWPKDLQLKVFSSLELPKRAKEFMESDQKAQAWMCSHYDSFHQKMHPHQMPIFIEKKDGKIICTIFDRRINLEKMRKSLFEVLLQQGAPVIVYLSTERRQYDWSTCPLLSINDLRKIHEMNRDKLYAFFKKNITLIEISSDGKWTLFVSNHLPAIFMELVQSIKDFEKYRKWALGNDSINQNRLAKVTSLVFKHIIKVGEEMKSEKINNLTMERYKEVICEIIFPLIEQGVHPKGCTHSRRKPLSRL